MSERDYAAEIDALAKRIEAIERAATCGTAPNEPEKSSPAQADVGEAPAESEWPRYYEQNDAMRDCIYRLRHDGARLDLFYLQPYRQTGKHSAHYRLHEVDAYVSGGVWRGVPRSEAEARIAAARGEKPQTVVEWAESIGVPFPADTDSHGCPVPPRSAPDDQPPFHVGQVVECVDAGVGNGVENCERYTVKAIRKAANPKDAWLVDVGNGGSVFDFRFRPIPATVEQGPTEGMQAVAAHCCLGQGNVGKSFLLRKMVEHIGPELAALRAELAEANRKLVELSNEKR